MLKKKKQDIKTKIDQIMTAVEDKVLDSELFLREAKQFYLLPENKDTTNHARFNEVLS